MSDLVVAKIGSSSLTGPEGLRREAVAKLAADVVEVRRNGTNVVVVTSGGVAAGLAPLGLGGQRPTDDAMLRVASAVGQTSLMRAYEECFGAEGLTVGQVLMVPTDLWNRRRYLKIRGTLDAMLAAGVVPVVNENDAVADDEIRFGDNDRLAALVAHLAEARLLVLLTDTDGLFTADPRRDASASLIEEIAEIDSQLEAMATGTGSTVGRGGMASKLAAARIATWSGVEAVIASADRPGVLAAAVQGSSGIGTRFVARGGRLGAKKLWIAFALPAAGRVVVDAGARRAVEERNTSLLVAGVTAAEGDFDTDDAVEVVDQDGQVFAKGLSRWPSADLRQHLGSRSSDLPEGRAAEVIHRDGLVIVPGGNQLAEG